MTFASRDPLGFDQTMILPDQVKLVTEWHSGKGGYGGNPATHALKALEEAVEFAIKCGADTSRVLKVVQDECQKAVNRDEVHPGVMDPQGMGEELADILISYVPLKVYWNIPTVSHISDKIPILQQRAWAVGPGGELRRPGRSEGDSHVG